MPGTSAAPPTGWVRLEGLAGCDPGRQLTLLRNTLCHELTG